MQLVEPVYAGAYIDRGVAHYRNGQNQLAINDWTKAIQLSGNTDAIAYNNRGVAYRHIGQSTLADADKTMACSLDSEYC